MRYKTKKAILVCWAVVVAGVGVAWASGDWGAAKSKADEFKNRQYDLKMLDREEVRKIVTAICEADEDARRDVGRDTSDRVSREVNDKYSDLERVRDDAYKLLDNVISDDNLKDNRDDAKRVKDEVKDRWESIDKMTRSLRGANHPVVSFMLDQGNRAHADRQGSCDAKEITVPSGRLDCAMATGETCLVIELKPDNKRGLENGRRQWRNYIDDLNKELKKPDSDIIKKLVNAKSDFARCKEFAGRVDCYKLCPEITEDGEYRDTRADWKRDCS